MTPFTAEPGDDILDGGTGRDVLSGEGSASGDGSTYSDEPQELWGGPAGSDTFVTRAGDGSTVAGTGGCDHRLPGWYGSDWSGWY